MKIMKIIYWVLVVPLLITFTATMTIKLLPPAHTTRADCTHAMKIHDRDATRLINKIAEQGEIISAYKHRLSMYDDLFEGEE